MYLCPDSADNCVGDLSEFMAGCTRKEKLVLKVELNKRNQNQCQDVRCLAKLDGRLRCLRNFFAMQSSRASRGSSNHN